MKISILKGGRRRGGLLLNLGLFFLLSILSSLPVVAQLDHGHDDHGHEENGHEENEGRAQIAPDIAQEAGIVTHIAG